MTDTLNIDYSRLPSHVAVIMDGNGRWAAAKGLPKVSGHKAGMEALRGVEEVQRNAG